MRLRLGVSCLVACIAVASWVGCGDELAAQDPAYIVRIDPAPGSDVCEGAIVTLVYDRDPGAVSVDGVALQPLPPAGRTRTIVVGFGPLIVTREFATPLDLDYVVLTCHPEPARLVRATPDPEMLTPVSTLEARGIVLEFDRPVADGEFELIATEGPVWTLAVTVTDARVALAPPPPGVLRAGETYVVSGHVIDLGGNQTDVHVEYTTVGDDEDSSE